MVSCLLRLAILSSAVLLSACASLVPNEYVISQERLSEKLKTAFPLQREAGSGMLGVRLDAPQIDFLVAQNRIALTTNIYVTSIISKDWEGGATLSSALRYDTNQRAIFLHDAHLESVQFNQNEAYVEMLKPLLDMVLREYSRENPLYRFKKDELHFAGTELDITGVEVVEHGIKLKLAPKQAAR